MQHYCKLNVTNPKTSGDTLYVNDYRNPSVNLKVAGPFTSGILYTALNYNLLVPNYPTNNRRLSYSLNLNGAMAIDKYFDAVPCKNNIISIDIN